MSEPVCAHVSSAAPCFTYSRAACEALLNCDLWLGTVESSENPDEQRPFKLLTNPIMFVIYSFINVISNCSHNIPQEDTPCPFVPKIILEHLGSQCFLWFQRPPPHSSLPLAHTGFQGPAGSPGALQTCGPRASPWVAGVSLFSAPFLSFLLSNRTLNTCCVWQMRAVPHSPALSLGTCRFHSRRC